MIHMNSFPHWLVGAFVLAGLAVDGSAQLIPSTGVTVPGDAAVKGGSTEENWSLSTLPNPSAPGLSAGPSHCVAATPDASWLAPANGFWIGPPTNNGVGSTNVAAGVYSYVVHFNLSAAGDLADLKIHCAFAVAGALQGILFNGLDTGVTGGSASTLTDVVFDASNAQFLAGDNYLQINVNNPSAAPSGIYFVDTEDDTTPFLTSNAKVDVLLGQPFQYQIATNHPAADLAVSPLPPGLALNPASGLIKGVATIPGLYPSTLVGYDRAGSDVFSESPSLTFAVSSWQQQALSIPADATSYGLATIAYGGGKFVAVDANNIAFASTDAIHWSGQAGAFSAQLPNAVAFGNAQFVAVAGGGGLYASADGLAWTPQTSPVTSDLYAVTFADGLFVAVGAGGVIVSSPDGKTWTDRTPTVSVGGDLNTVAYGGGLFLAEGVGAAVSTDGMNWTAATLPPNPITGSYDVITETVKALTYGPLGFVAGGSASGYDIHRRVPPASATFTFTTQDGQSWQNPGLFVPSSPFLISLAQAGGVLVGIGADSSAYFSQDSINWLLMELPSNFTLAQSYAANVVCYGGGHFVIAGADLNGNASVAIHEGAFALQSTPSLLSFSQPLYTVHESAGAIGIVLSRSGNTAIPVSALVTTGVPNDAEVQSETPYSIGASLEAAYAATPGQDYQPVSTVVSFLPGEVSKTISIPILDRHSASAGRREIGLALTPLSDAAIAGAIPQSDVSILNDEVALQVTGSTVIEAWPPNDDYSADFAGNLSVQSFSAAPSGPIQIKLTAHAGYYNTTFDPPPALPADIDLGTMPVSSSIPAGSSATVSVSGATPPPQGDTSAGIFWIVYAVVEQETGGVWYDSPSAWAVIDGPSAYSISVYTGPPPKYLGGGVIQTSTLFLGGNLPAFTGQQTPALQSVSIEGPAEIDELASGSFSAICTFSDGSSSAAPDTTWRSSLFSISSSGVLTAGTVAAATTASVTGAVSVGGVTKSATKTVRIAPLTPGVSLSVVTPYARRTGSTLPGVFRLARTGSTLQPLTVTVNVTAGPGAAQPGVDYTALPASVTILAGSASVDVPVEPLPPSGAVPDLTVQLNLSPITKTSGYTLGRETTGTVTIVGSNSLQFASAAVATTPGASSVSLTVQRDPNEDPSAALTVDYSTADGTALAGVDYTSSSGALTFASNVSQQTITIPLLTNPFADGNRAFTVNLANPGASDCLGAPAACTVTVAQNVLASATSIEGAYYGISPDSVPAYLQANVGPKGAFTAAIRSPAVNLALSGAFDAYGYYSRKLPLSGTSALLVELQAALNPSGNPAGAIVGRVLRLVDNQVASTITTLQAGANIYAAPGNPFLANGAFTMLLPRDPGRSADASYPQGDGYAFVAINDLGGVRAVGVLGDGTPFTLGAGFSAATQFPFYLTPYPIRGLVAGSMTFVNTPGVSDFAGALAWTKPAQAGASSTGFTGTISALGSFYQPPPKGELLLPLNVDSNGDAHATVLLGSATSSAVSESITITPADKVTVSPADPSFALTLTRSTGYFSGRFGQAGEPNAAFKGVIFQKQNIAQGLFIRKSQSGYVEIGP